MSNFDDDFDRAYADKMRQQTDHDFSEADWPVLSGRLDEDKRKRWRGFPFWVTVALAGLLLLTNLFWFLNYRQSVGRGEKAQDVTFVHPTDRGELSQTTPPGSSNEKAQASENATFAHPSIGSRASRNVTSVHNDTVYIYPKTRENRLASMNETELRSASEGELLAELERRFPLAMASVLAKNGSAPAVQKAPETADQPAENHAVVMDKVPLAGSPKIGHRILWPFHPGKKPLIFIKNNPGTTEPPTVENERKPRRLLQHDWWATRYTGGWLLPISDDLTKKSGNSFGAELEYGFSPDRSVWIEISQSSLTCTGNATDDYGVETPYRHDFRITHFETVKGPKKSIRLGFGGRWRQAREHKWGRVGVGVGYILEYPQAYNLHVRWENLFDTNLNDEQDLSIPKEGYAIGYLHGDIGIEWRLGSSWLASLNYWREAKGHYRDGMPGYTGLKAGLAYKF